MKRLRVQDKNTAELLQEVQQLRRAVSEQGEAIFAEYEPFIQRPEYRSSALNLGKYLALRRYDLTPLQLELIHLGFASLGRVESNVLGTLSAIEKILDSLVNGTPYSPPDPARAFWGLNRLDQETTQVLGPQPADRAVRIMVTLPGEAASDPQLVADLLARGMDCARINCAHDNAALWKAMIDNVRAAAAAQGRTCRIYMDIAGPKIRTEALGFDKRARLYMGDTLLLVRGQPSASPEYPHQVSCALPEILDQLQVGQMVWFDDGKIGARLVRTEPQGLVLKIEQTSPEGMRVRVRKGINFPDTRLNISPLTAKDLHDLDFIVQHADMVGYSFVQTAADISLLQSEIEKRLPSPDDRQRIAIIAKIETKLAVTNLPELILRGAGRQPFGVMVARGDLAVEIGFTRLAEIQEEILWVCEAAHVPVIWATQVLESVTKRGVLSRAEITDAAEGIQAECVMLNKGEYLGQAVSTLCDVLRRMTGHQYKKFNTLRALKSWEHYIDLG